MSIDVDDALTNFEYERIVFVLLFAAGNILFNKPFLELQVWAYIVIFMCLFWCLVYNM